MGVLDDLLLHLRQMLRKALKGLIRPLDGPHLLGLTAFRGRPEEHPQGELGLAALLGEGHRDVKLSRLALFVPAVGVDQTLGFHDLDIDDLILIVDAIGAMHDEPPNAPGSHVHLVSSGRKVFWSPPLRHVFRIGPRLEHELSRRIEDPRDDDFPIGCIWFVHDYSASLALARYSAS
jgi:hypothetical protein